MPLIAYVITALTTFLTSIFTAFFGYAIQFLTRKWALYGAALALFVTLQAGFLALVNGLMTGIAVTMPAELVTAWGWFAPANAAACMAAIIAAHGAKYIYDLNVKFLFKGFANLGGR